MALPSLKGLNRMSFSRQASRSLPHESAMGSRSFGPLLLTGFHAERRWTAVIRRHHNSPLCLSLPFPPFFFNPIPPLPTQMKRPVQNEFLISS
jgi:hypothetical protein